MPDEIEAAVNAAVRDERVKVMILRGAGRSFCGGFDFGDGFHQWDEHITTDGAWDPGKNFMFATAPALAPTQKFMSLWRSPKPVIAQVHGWCVGGGSDYALCADLVIASEDARIGTPYSRMWGAWLSGMWLSGRAVRGLQPGSAGPAAEPEERDPVTIDAVASVENRRANPGRAGIMRGSLSRSSTPQCP